MRRHTLIVGSELLLALILGGCTTLPPGSNFPKRFSTAYAHPEQTKIGQQFAAATADHSGDSAFRILSVGIDGFAARMQLIGIAEHSLDLQYFIFHQDTTGRLLTAALLRAADRGVHVRLLIDDGATEPGDGQIRLLSAHPQIELRIFNPFAYRGDSKFLRAGEFLFNHRRLDFRMHNKLFIADNASALIGGRNIGDQYFQIDPDGQYADDDVFVAGATVAQLSGKFDTYWNSALAIPVEALSGGLPHDGELNVYRDRLARATEQAHDMSASYLQRADSADPIAGILQGRLPLVWTPAQVVCDSPEKRRVENGEIVGRLMYVPVAKAAADVQTELLMITPYFVPTKEEFELLKALRRRNIRIRVLTNSLDSTTEISAQAGYDRHRIEILKIGVELFELRALLGNTRGSGQSVKISRYGNYGLHAKLYIFDRQKLFIGSMNFDQRSMRLNTEIGLIIDGADLAQQSATRFESMTQLANAYRLSLTPDATGKEHLVWQTQEGGHSVVYTREPSRSLWRRIQARILSLLPLDREM